MSDEDSQLTADGSKDNKNGVPMAHDLPIWKRFLDRTNITVGCTNLFDHDPPRSNDNFPRFIYDPTGRFVYVSLTKKF
jgi:outer membrane receptor protein involved in Fe transport